MRCLSSGPWQAKQLSERMGRMSRLKSTSGPAAKARADRVIPRKRRASKSLPPLQLLFWRILGAVA